MNLLELPELVYDSMLAILYLPVIPKIAFPLMHFFARTSWSIVQSFVGYDKKVHLDLTFMPMMARNDVGGTSAKNLLHWTQNMRSGDFRPFDYGAKGNMVAYGQ